MLEGILWFSKKKKIASSVLQKIKIKIKTCLPHLYFQKVLENLMIIFFLPNVFPYDSLNKVTALFAVEICHINKHCT